MRGCRRGALIGSVSACPDFKVRLSPPILTGTSPRSTLNRTVCASGWLLSVSVVSNFVFDFIHPVRWAGDVVLQKLGKRARSVERVHLTSNVSGATTFRPLTMVAAEDGDCYVDDTGRVFGEDQAGGFRANLKTRQSTLKLLAE